MLEPSISKWRLIRLILWREHVLGVVAYICSVAERPGNRWLGLMLLACAATWSFSDPIAGRMMSQPGRMAVFEAVLLYLGAIAVANVLGFFFLLLPRTW